MRIGHAPKDEKGKGSGGVAGDQNGKEVCIRSWYNGDWEFVARAKIPAVAERMAAACEAACANPNVGYDQGGRNTLRAEAEKVGYDLAQIKTPCEADCSALMAVCAAAAGVTIPGGNAPTTRTLKKVLKNTGVFEILTDKIYLTGSGHLLRGDILCKKGSHTVMALDNGKYAVDHRTGASDNETAAPDNKNSGGATYSLQLPLLKRGCAGDTVRALQMLLKGWGYDLGKSGPNKDGIDGDFGGATENAVECFREDNNLPAGGDVDGQTWGKLLGIN